MGPPDRDWRVGTFLGCAKESKDGMTSGGGGGRVVQAKGRLGRPRLEGQVQLSSRLRRPKGHRVSGFQERVRNLAS